MLINIRKKGIRPVGVIHVGAHWAQEHETYIKMGCHKVIYIEPASAAFKHLCDKFHIDKNVTLVNAACGQRLGRATLNIEKSNQGQSNSLLEMGTHLKEHPGIVFVDSEIVEVVPLDLLNTKGYDFLNIDVQGFELDVLKGGKETLKHINWVYCEVNREEVYRGCARVEQIDEILQDFNRVETKWHGGWGDALYTRK